MFTVAYDCVKVANNCVFPKGHAVEESLCNVGTSHLRVLQIVATWLHNHQQTGTNSSGCQQKLQ